MTSANEYTPGDALRYLYESYSEHLAWIVELLTERYGDVGDTLPKATGDALDTLTAVHGDILTVLIANGAVLATTDGDPLFPHTYSTGAPVYRQARRAGVEVLVLAHPAAGGDRR